MKLKLNYWLRYTSVLNERLKSKEYMFITDSIGEFVDNTKAGGGASDELFHKIHHELAVQINQQLETFRK